MIKTKEKYFFKSFKFFLFQNYWVGVGRDYIEASLIDKIVVKGKTVPVKIYELISRKGEIPDEKIELKRLYETALNMHWDRNFDPAADILRGILEIQPDQASVNLLARIEDYLDNPPPEEWQGEFIRTRKD